MHVIMIPLEGNRLPASELRSYKGGLRTRLTSLYAAVGAKHGLIARTSLKGAVKKAAAKAVIAEFNHRGIPTVMENVWPAMKTCIQNSPDEFLGPLGIQITQLTSSGPEP